MQCSCAVLLIKYGVNNGYFSRVSAYVWLSKELITNLSKAFVLILPSFRQNVSILTSEKKVPKIKNDRRVSDWAYSVSNFSHYFSFRARNLVTERLPQNYQFQPAYELISCQYVNKQNVIENTLLKIKEAC